MTRRWNIPVRDPAEDRALGNALGTSHVLAALLRNRGFKDVAAARGYIQPKLTELEDPLVLLDMERAAARVREAVRRKERIIVYGDYDVDGTTGTVILMNFLRLAQGRVEPYIPDRLREGYSFSGEAIDAFLSSAEKPGLIITVDHGTSAREGIRRLAEAGVDVIVTDHHEPPEHLPEHAYALINPRRPGCPSRFKSLCGAGVAFKLAWAAAQAFSGAKKVSPEFREFLLEAMAMVSLATITDVVPLLGENRVICFHGLHALAVTKNPGLQALLLASRLKGQSVRAVHVGFRLGPRLNAAGRMGISKTAVDLLTERDPERALELAKTLEAANDRRRLLEQEMLAEILALPEIRNFKGGRGICLGKAGWHVGVIGIVAARLVDRFQVPVLIAALNGAIGRGSARSPAGVNLAGLLVELSEHLVSHGGHAGAAGCTVTELAFPGFQRAFELASARALAKSTHVPAIEIDLELPFATIRKELVEELELLAPHGEANPPALFCTRNTELVGRPKVLGKDKAHLAFHIRQGDVTYRCVAFGKGGSASLLGSPGQRLDICYRLKFDTYVNPGSVELEVEDFHTAG